MVGGRRVGAVLKSGGAEDALSFSQFDINTDGGQVAKVADRFDMVRDDDRFCSPRRDFDRYIEGVAEGHVFVEREDGGGREALVDVVDEYVRQLRVRFWAHCLDLCLQEREQGKAACVAVELKVLARRRRAVAAGDDLKEL